MSGRDFRLSTTIIYGPDGIILDGTAGNSDDGDEYTTVRTTSGTPGSSSAYVQYAFATTNDCY